MTNAEDRLAASVRQRLLNIARAEGIEFEYLLLRYANERLLYRLSRSDTHHYFVLKGAMVFLVWQREVARQSRDIDLLAATAMASEHVEQTLRGLCTLEVEPDGLRFDANSIRTQEIREQTEHGGIRVQVTAYLGTARVHLQIDIAFGDVVSPGPEEAELPTLLDMPPPRLAAYPKETVVAEKFEAMVRLGEGNTRFKDFFDIWSLCTTSGFDGEALKEAVRATFERRGTAIPSAPPSALQPAFAEQREAQWRAFLRRVAVDDAPSLSAALGALRAFLVPICQALADGEPLGRWDPATGTYSIR